MSEKTEFGERLAVLVDAKWPGRGGRRRAATAFGVNESQLSKYIKGPTIPETPTLLHMASVLNVEPNDLLGGSSTTVILKNVHFSTSVQLPFIGHVQAGGGIDEPADADSAETVSVADTFRGASGVYRVRGKSMLGANIQEGDELIVKLNPDPASGDVVVAWKVRSGAMVKRFQQDSFHRYLLSEPGDGIPTDKQGVIPIDDGDRIIGVVVGIQRKYKPEAAPRNGAAPATKAKKK